MLGCWFVVGLCVLLLLYYGSFGFGVWRCDLLGGIVGFGVRCLLVVCCDCMVSYVLAVGGFG